MRVYEPGYEQRACHRIPFRSDFKNLVPYVQSLVSFPFTDDVPEGYGIVECLDLQVHVDAFVRIDHGYCGFLVLTADVAAFPHRK